MVWCEVVVLDCAVIDCFALLWSWTTNMGDSFGDRITIQINRQDILCIEVRMGWITQVILPWKLETMLKKWTSLKYKTIGIKHVYHSHFSNLYSRIQSRTPILWWENRIVDLSSSLTGPVFQPLQDMTLFCDFSVDPALETILLSNGADLTSEYLYFQSFKNDISLREQFILWGYSSSETTSQLRNLMPSFGA